MLSETTDPSLLGQICIAFLEDSAKRILALREAANGTDFKLLRRTAHAVKGASASIGAQGMSDLAQQLELLEDEADLTEMMILIKQLEHEFERVKLELSVLGHFAVPHTQIS